MSFYGNRLYQLTNAFGKIFVKNSGKDKINFPNATNPTNDQDAAFAVGLEATYSFDTGNKWITLSKDDANGICFISHSAIDTNDKSNDIATLAAASENASATQLLAGGYIAVPHIAYDDAGHVTGTNETSYFRLPLNPTGMDLDALKARMDTIEANDTTQDGTLTSLDSRCDSLEATAKIVGSRTGFSSKKTLTGALGDMDSWQDTVGLDSNATVSEGIVDLHDRVTELESTVEFVGERATITSDATLTMAAAVGNMDEVMKTYPDVANAILGLMEEISMIKNSITFITGALGAIQDDIEELQSYHSGE